MSVRQTLMPTHYERWWMCSHISRRYWYSCSLAASLAVRDARFVPVLHFRSKKGRGVKQIDGKCISIAAAQSYGPLSLSLSACWIRGLWHNIAIHDHGKGSVYSHIDSNMQLQQHCLTCSLKLQHMMKSVLYSWHQTHDYILQWKWEWHSCMASIFWVLHHVPWMPFSDTATSCIRGCCTTSCTACTLAGSCMK